MNYSFSEVAVLLRCSESTVARFVAVGLIDAYSLPGWKRYGIAPRITRSAVFEFRCSCFASRWIR